MVADSDGDAALLGNQVGKVRRLEQVYQGLDRL